MFGYGQQLSKIIGISPACYYSGCSGFRTRLYNDAYYSHTLVSTPASGSSWVVDGSECAAQSTVSSHALLVDGEWYRN